MVREVRGMTRRGALGRALVAAMSTLVVASCTSPPPPATPPTATSTPTSSIRPPSQIVVGVDDVQGGYNPHNLADTGQVTSILTQLLLPSVFRRSGDGSPELDSTVMRSAKVVREQPFTVVYQIRRDAAWSDGAPIAAEDFSYLAEAMREEPGTIDAAGYRLISDVVSGEGGKRVEVTFTRAYPGWRSLFSGLLPAHLLKDTPGGWRDALESGYPAVGGPFSVRTLDTARGEILLERNERYWEKPAAVDQLILRRSDQKTLLEALRGGSDQLAYTMTSAHGLRALQGLPGVELTTVPRAEVAEVLLRPVEGPLANADTRAGVAALIDRNALVAAGAQGGPSARLRADSQLVAPSLPGYRPSLPATRRAPEPQLAGRLLTKAGYTRLAGRWVDAQGRPLRLVIASGEEREPYGTLAEELARQLERAGIGTKVVTPDARTLYGSTLAPETEDAEEESTESSAPPEPTESESGTEAEGAEDNIPVDIVLSARPMSEDVATGLASAFGCVEEKDDAGKPVKPRPGGPAGFCAEDLQPAISAALTGELPLPEATRRLEPALWRANVAIPLFQLADTLVLSDGVSGVIPGPAMSGPFGSAVNWVRISR